MRNGELVRLAIGGLWRQKMRTTLTLVGVLVGTCALAFSLSLGLGLRSFIDNQFQGRDEFWRLVVHAADPPPDPSEVPPDQAVVRGDMSDARRQRIREALVERYLSARPRKNRNLLTPDKLAAIAALPDVTEVRTFRTCETRVTAENADRTEKPVNGVAVTGMLSDLQPRLIAGRLPAGPTTKEVLLSELVLYDLGYRSDRDLDRALGMPVRVVVGGLRNAPPLTLARLLTGRLPGDDVTVGQLELLEKLTTAMPRQLDNLDLSAREKADLKQLLETKSEPEDDRMRDAAPAASETFTVCGVVRVLNREDRKEGGPLASWELASGNVFLPALSGGVLFDHLPGLRAAEIHSADVRVRPGGDLPGTVAAIEAMGFSSYTSLKWFANAKREVTLIAGGLNLFAMIALLVAGIGITNTLVTSVVERTREIGIMRSVGATRGQIVGLFLTEGTVIGLAGSMLGLAAAYALAIPADRWVWKLIEKQSEGEKLLAMTVFEFPWWLSTGAMVFSALVTTLAALYPARRAARIHPIEALRYS